jgi:WD40 repeat protein
MLKCENFKTNLDNGVDQVKDHCIRLRSQVQLEKELMTECLHQLNEKLIGEIDNYEKQCVSSFNNKKIKYYGEKDKLLAEMAKFCTDNLAYLTQFRLDNGVVVQSLTKVERYLAMMDVEEDSLKSVKFDGKYMNFTKNENKYDSSLLGVLDFMALNVEFPNQSELKFSCKNILQDYLKCIHLFKTNNGNNTVFYIGSGFYMRFVTFDNEGKVLAESSSNSRCKNESDELIKQPKNQKISQLKVIRLISGYYLVFITQDNSLSSILDKMTESDFEEDQYKIDVEEGQHVSDVRYSRENHGDLFIIDEHLNCLQRMPLNYHMSHMAANSTNIVCGDSMNKFYCYSAFEKGRYRISMPIWLPMLPS